MNEKENPVDEILKDITVPEGYEKEEYQKDCTPSLFALSKQPTENLYDGYLDNILKEVSSIATYILENRENIEKTLDVIETINNLSDQEKQELARQIEEQSLQLPPDGTNPYDKGSDLCKSEGMTKINTLDTSSDLALINPSYSKPQKFLQLNTLDWREIYKNANAFIGDGALLPVDKKKGIYNFIQLTFPDEDSSLSKKLSLIDRSFANGVMTFYHNNKQGFTLKQLYQLVRNRVPTEKNINDLEKSVDKQRVLLYSHKWTNQAKKYNLGRNLSDEELEKISVVTEEYFLPLRKTTIIYNGVSQPYYTFIKEPPMYTHAREMRQLYEVEEAVRSISTTDFNYTDKNTLILEYLISAVQTSNSKIIKRNFDKLYEECEIYSENASEKTKQKSRDLARKTIKTILDDWKRKGYISSYEFIKGGVKNGYHQLEIHIPSLKKTVKKIPKK